MQCVVVGERVRHLHLKVAGIAILAVGTESGELYVLSVDLIGLPDAVVEGDGATAMQAVGTVVDGELVVLAVNRELAFGDAIAVATDEGSEVAAFCAVLLVVSDVVMSEADIGHVAVLVGDHDADDASSEVREAHFHAFSVGEDVECRGVAGKVVGVKPGEGQGCRAVGAFGVRGRLASASSHAESCCCESKTEIKILLHAFLFD